MPWIDDDEPFTTFELEAHLCKLPPPGNVDEHLKRRWVCPDPECRRVWENDFLHTGMIYRERTWVELGAMSPEDHRRAMRRSEE